MVNEISCVNYRNWNRTRNNGDAITPFIVQLMTGIPAKFSAWDVPHLIGIGSILALANRFSHVWGAGYLNPTIPHSGVFDCKFHAVRGYRTLDHLRKMGVSLPDIPLGDPGIFVGGLVQSVLYDAPTAFKAALIPHHNSVNHPFFENAKGNRDFVLVDILDDTLKPIELIARSEIVISQSLHGLIYAESLGKPSIWISDRADPIWNFKFEDWFSTTAEPQQTPEPMSKSLSELLKLARRSGTLIDKKALASAFPLVSVAGKSNAFLSFVSCRRECPLVLTVDSIFTGHRYGIDELTDDFLKSVGSYLFPRVYHLFGNRSERSYCAILPADEPTIISEEVMQSVCKYLDHHNDVDYAYILPSVDVDLPEGTRRTSRDAKPGVPAAGGAVILRPDSNALTKNFVTFYLE